MSIRKIIESKKVKRKKEMHYKCIIYRDGRKKIANNLATSDDSRGMDTQPK